MEKCYCTKSELDLFTTSPIQLAIDRSSFVEIHPVASISDNNTIEFLISAQHKTNISYDDYKENICLYVFDLTQEKSASEPFGNVTRSGDISIHLKFDAELPKTATLIAYMEMPSLIEIDKSRNNVVLRKDISDKRIVYFKILNNSEIVQYIHNDAQEECFGFCQLHRTDPNDKFKVFSPNKHLFVNLLDCVLDARDITSAEGDCPRFQ
ncbi:uncharacterized protein TNCV_905081 [Trichonephila clavipes]|nr:uncharacterized protein TNCV_905081 [Trichonephila clavipes]